MNTENNKLIAEFIGKPFTDEPQIKGEFYDLGSKLGILKLERMKFHSDWNWLMSVVEKIESLGHGVTIYRKGCQINDIYNTANGFNHSSKLEQTYKAVVEFIKWYNENK